LNVWAKKWRESEGVEDVEKTVGGNGFPLQFYKIGHLVNKKYYCPLDRGINLVTVPSTCMCGIFVSISWYFPSSVSYFSKNFRFSLKNVRDIGCLFDCSSDDFSVWRNDYRLFFVRLQWITCRKRYVKDQGNTHNIMSPNNLGKIYFIMIKYLVNCKYLRTFSTYS